MIERIEGDTVYLSLSGEITRSEIPSIRQLLSPYLNEHYKKFIINVNSVTLVDSSGIGLLIALVRHSEHNHGFVTLHRPSSLLLEILEIIKLKSKFNITQ